MITQDQYNQLVEKIVEAVPEIRTKKQLSKCIGEKCMTWGWSMRCDSAKYETIDRPIQLADVMRALSEIKVEGRKILYGLAVTTKGDFLFNCVSSPEVGREWLYRFNNKIGHITWDLSKPLDLQSDATKESLYNLIVKP